MKLPSLNHALNRLLHIRRLLEAEHKRSTVGALRSLRLQALLLKAQERFAQATMIPLARRPVLVRAGVPRAMTTRRA